MGEKAAELWQRATEIDTAAEESWDTLVRINQQLDWDRDALRERATDDRTRQRVGVPADD